MPEKDKFVYSETATFNEMVAAEANSKNLIIFLSASKYDQIYTPANVEVGDTPLYLVNRGFPETLIFSRDHFEKAMLPNMGTDYNTHMHGQSSDELKKLPEVIAKPVLILREQGMTGNYNPLTFIYANPRETDEYGRPLFMKAVVQPNDFYDSVLAPRKAAKVITYYTLRENQIKSMTNDIVLGRYDVLAFDKRKYDELEEQINKTQEFQAVGCKSFVNLFRSADTSFIVNSFEDSCASKNATKSRFYSYEQKMRVIAEIEIQNFLDNSYSQNYQFGPIVHGKALIEDRDASLRDILAGANMIIKSAELTLNEYLTSNVRTRVHDIVSQNVLSWDNNRFAEEIKSYRDYLESSVSDKEFDLLHCDDIDTAYDISELMMNKIKEHVPDFRTPQEQRNMLDKALSAVVGDLKGGYVCGLVEEIETKLDSQAYEAPGWGYANDWEIEP